MEEEILGIITLFFFFFSFILKSSSSSTITTSDAGYYWVEDNFNLYRKGNWMNWIFFLKRTIKSSVENNLHLRFLFHSSYPRRILKLYSIEISTLKRYPSCIYYPNPYLLSLFPSRSKIFHSHEHARAKVIHRWLQLTRISNFGPCLCTNPPSLYSRGE